jgi:hypothetical protein
VLIWNEIPPRFQCQLVVFEWSNTCTVPIVSRTSRFVRRYCKSEVVYYIAVVQFRHCLYSLGAHLLSPSQTALIPIENKKKPIQFRASFTPHSRCYLHAWDEGYSKCVGHAYRTSLRSGVSRHQRPDSSPLGSRQRKDE